MKKIQMLTLVVLALALTLAPGVQAKTPLGNIVFVKDLPEEIVAGSTYETIITFDNVASESVPLYVDIMVTCMEAPLDYGEIIIDTVALSGGALVCVETAPGHFLTEPGTLKARTSYELRITVSSLVNLMPGTYTFEIDLLGEEPVTPPPPPPPSNAKPIAEAGPNKNSLVDRIVYFDGSGSYDPDGMILSWSWSLGDGATASGKNVQHKYTKPGQYTVKLTVQDNRGAGASDTCTVTVTEPPAPVTNEFTGEVPGEVTDYLVDALNETGTTVTLSTTKPVTVTVLKYEGNPHPEAPMPEYALPIYVDVEVSNLTAVKWPIYVEVHYTDEMVMGKDEASLGIYYYKAGAWHRCIRTGVDPDRNVVWAYMTKEEAEGSPILVGYTPLRPAEFTVSNLVITPTLVEPGEEVTISLMISNVGEAPGNYTVTLKVEGVWMDIVYEVSLAGGESVTREFKFSPETEGIYTVEGDGLTGSFEVKAPTIPLRPAEFEVSNLVVSPTEVTEGEEVTITVDVANIGEEEGAYIIILKVDRDTVETKEITLGGGASTTIAFTLLEEAGMHTVEIEDMTVPYTLLRTRFTVNEKPVPFWMQTGFIAFVSVLIIGGVAIIYMYWKRKT